jgi:hypothetical protein
MNTDRRWICTAKTSRPAILWLAGGLALAIGMLVYLTDRPAAHTLLLSHLAAGAGEHRLFGRVGGWLPAFAHALAFSLFSAALLAPRPPWEYGACAFWFAVNAAFELGQHPQIRAPLADALHHALGDGPIARSVAGDFLQGSFDMADLAAAALGAAVAAAFLQGLRVRQGHPDGR